MKTKLVRTEDAAKFVEAKLAEYKVRYDKNKAEYEIYKDAYESKFLRRLFGIKHRIDWYNDWEFIDFGGYIHRLERIQPELTYDLKCKHEHTDCLDEYSYSTFYKWCSDNNIPY